MAEKSVRWTETAAKQRLSVLEYWLKRTQSSDYSIKLLYLIKERIEYLVEHPLSGYKTDFSDTRVASMGHYSIYYKVFDHGIIITAFWDNRQDPEKLYRLLTTNK